MFRMRQKREVVYTEPEIEAAFHIREEFLRWDNVKTAHDLMDDMEVARMLLDCYDLVGGSFLVWSDQAKLAPPPLYTTLRLQHVTPEGWEILQEIKALGAWSKKKATKRRKSRRKQAQVQRIVVKKEQEDVYLSSPEDLSADEDYDIEEDDYDYEDHDYEIGTKSRSKSQQNITPSKKVEKAAKKVEKKVKRGKGRPRKGESVNQKGAPSRRRSRTKDGDQPQQYWGRYARKTTRVWQCKYCPTQVDLQSELREHYNEKHKKTVADLAETEQMEMDESFQMGRDGTLLWRCLHCKELLKQKDDHLKLHDRRERLCNICGKVLNTEVSYKKHMSNHDARERGVKIMCKLCGQTYPTPDALKRHMKYHSTTRPYQCDICGKGFKTKGLLSRHTLIHVETKPYNCQYCGKGFNNESNFRGHVRIHTGEKPYKCDICGAAFTHNVSLKSHKKSAHGIDMWQVPLKRCVEVTDEIIKTTVIEGIAEKTEGKSDGDNAENKPKLPATSANISESNLPNVSTIKETSTKKEVPSLSHLTIEPRAFDLSHPSKSIELATTQAEENPMPQHSDNKPTVAHPSCSYSSSEPHQSRPLIPPYPPLPPVHHLHLQMPTTGAAGDYHNIQFPPMGALYNSDRFTSDAQSAHQQEYWNASKQTFTKL